MSAASPEAPPTMPTMVSRLPKFGFQAKSVTSSGGAHPGPAPPADVASTRLTNGFYHHPGPVGVNSAGPGSAPSVKQNGFLRVPASFAAGCEQDGGDKAEKRGNPGQNRPASARQPQPVARATAGKGRVLTQPMTSLMARSLPVPKGSSRPAQNLTNGPKQAPNGGAARPWTGRGGSPRQPQSLTPPVGSRSGSPLQKKQAGRSHSSDDLGSAPPVPLTQSDRLRSRSLNQVRRQASPTPGPSSASSSPVATRSFLYGGSRPRPKPLWSPPPSARGTPPAGAQSPEGGGWGRPGIAGPSLLKKPLLPSVVPSPKNSGVSYKLSRPSPSKQLRPLRVTPPRAQEATEAPRAEAPPTARSSQSGLSRRGRRLGVKPSAVMVNVCL